MKRGTFIPAASLLAAFTISGLAYAATPDDAPRKAPDAKEWAHHGEGPWSALPEEKRKLLHDTMEKVHKQNEALHEQKRKLKAEMDAILVAPEFDRDAFAKKTAELSALHAKMKQNQEQALASILGQFTQEERIELVVMHHMMEMRMHHHGHWHGENEGSHGPRAENMMPPEQEADATPPEEKE